jgi:ankyrin repeat protein
MHHAFRHGDVEIISLLIDHGADVDAKTEWGHFPLYCAGGHGHAEAVRLLLARGTDPNTRFPDGLTLLDWLHNHKGNALSRPVIGILTKAINS